MGCDQISTRTSETPAQARMKLYTSYGLSYTAVDRFVVLWAIGNVTSLELVGAELPSQLFGQMAQ